MTNVYAEQIERIAERFPEHPYLIPLDGDAVTFGEFHALTQARARCLHRWGVEPGDRVLLAIDNRPDFVVWWYACQLVGAVAAPINPDLTDDSHRYLLGLVEPRLAVHGLGAEACGLRDLLVGAGVPVHDLDGVPVGREPEEVRGDGGFVVRDVDLDAPSQIIFTSGTTGRPKGAIQTPRLVGGLSTLAERTGLVPEDRLLTASPMFHGLGQGWYQYSQLVGSGVVIAPRLSVRRFWDDARRHGITAMQHVGATLSFLLAQPESPLDRDHSIRFTMGIGAPRHIWEAFTERFGIPIIEFYGMTEIGMVTFNDPPGRPGSVGRLSGGCDVRLVDAEGRDVPDGEVGELWTRPTGDAGKHPEYFREPEATAATIIDDWFHTGDLLRRDEDGYWFFVGRGSDSLRQRGENIVPEDIERAVATLEEVADAAAVGVPSRHGDMDIKLCLSLRPLDADPTDERMRALAEGIADALPRAMRPRLLEIHEALPYTATNKIQRALLRRTTGRVWDVEAGAWRFGADVPAAAGPSRALAGAGQERSTVLSGRLSDRLSGRLSGRREP